MVTGFMVFISALMFFGLVTSAYSMISKLTRKGRSSRRLHDRRKQEDPRGKREAPGTWMWRI
jgi:hypothetical protein